MSLSFEALQKKKNKIEAQVSSEFLLRVHRSISWVARGQSLDGDEDLKFICYWIAFNSAYAKQQGFEAQGISDRHLHSEFFDKLNSLDKDQRIYDTIWKEFAGKVRNLMANKFIFKPFWPIWKVTFQRT